MLHRKIVEEHQRSVVSLVKCTMLMRRILKETSSMDELIGLEENYAGESFRLIYQHERNGDSKRLWRGNFEKKLKEFNRRRTKESEN